MKGGLKLSNHDYNAQHPILLTAKHPVVQILLDKAHRDNLHESTEYVRNMLQQEYCIIALRNALSKIKSRCTMSRRYHDLRKICKTAQSYADMIGKRWTRKYLPQKNQRSKWSKEHVRNLKEGELVWLVDDSVKSSRDVSNADTGTPIQSTHRWQTYPEKNLMNMSSHLLIPVLITSDPLKWSSYDVHCRDGAASSLV